MMENGERLQQLDGSNNHALLRRTRNGSTLLHSKSNDIALLSSFASNNFSPFDENTKLKNRWFWKLWSVPCENYNYSDVARELGVSCFNDTDDLCEQHPEVILLCTSILSTVKLKRSTLFVNVLSVKEFPRNLFFQHLPPDFDVLCTHPMFGPESGKNGWKKLPLIYDKFFDIFASEGCKMVEMSCAKHDWHAAGSQFVTHITGRFLEKLGLETTSINTKGYETLFSLVENT
ncbi:hypothetical protein S245_056368, partial [Arachis hypogaea]